jgi:hypothetical protein
VSSLIKRLLREVFKHHSNPWSAWTRLLSVPLVFVPIWTRSWREGAIVVVWLIVNPMMFREPKNDKAWATRAMLGEEMWIAKRPLDRAMASASERRHLAWAVSGKLTSDVYCRRRYARFGQVALLLAHWRELALYYERHRGEGA